MLRVIESTTGKEICVIIECCMLLYFHLYIFMKTPDRHVALRNAKITICNKDRRIVRLKKKLEDLNSNRGIEVDWDQQVILHVHSDQIT